MYTPAPFREERDAVLCDAVRQIRFATLVTVVGGLPQISHLPMVLRGNAGQRVLEGHVARANLHWSALQGGAEASIAIFQGPHAYVSPSWYASKTQHGKVVPTWTYVAVHVHGRLEAVEDAAWLADHLDALTALNEQDRPEPWQVADAPAEFTATLSRAIVGLRLPVERLEGSWKLLQHKQAPDRLGVIEGLSASPRHGDREVAEIMRRLEAARPGAG